jgi:hypothetical protein
MENTKFILDEKQARKKMCPFIVATDNDEKLSGNVTSKGFILSYCQANKCMAWIPVESPETMPAGYCSRC